MLALPFTTRIHDKTEGTGKLFQNNAYSSYYHLFIIIAAALLLSVILPTFGYAIDEDIVAQDKISGYRSEVNKLQQSISKQEQKMLESEGKEHNLLAELEKLDMTLISQQEKLDDLEQQVQKQQHLIDDKQIELDILVEKRKTVETHLIKRITAYYTLGDIGLLNIAFSTKSLSELLLLHDSFNSVIEYDQDVILRYKDVIADQQRAKNAQQLQKSMLEQFRNQAEQEQLVLLDTKQEKKELLTLIRTQSKLHQQAITELQQATDTLVDAIVEIKNKNQIYEDGFLANKGSHPPPVNGTIITLFQQEKRNKLGILKKAQGIELKANDGTDIIAVSSGQVIFSGYLRGYGNTVIIHHGYQYYTVTSRIEKLIAQKGGQVVRGEIIGIMGDTATLFEEGLYFEIRHGKVSLDPLLWLNPNRLTSLHE